MRFKSLLLGFLGVTASLCAQVTVQKTSGTNIINNGPIAIGTTETIASGGTLISASGSTVDLRLGTVMLPSGTGTVNSFSFSNANGITGTVTNPTTTPSLTLALGAITPTSAVFTSGGDSVEINTDNIPGGVLANTGNIVAPAGIVAAPTFTNATGDGPPNFSFALTATLANTSTGYAVNYNPMSGLFTYAADSAGTVTSFSFSPSSSGTVTGSTSAVNLTLTTTGTGSFARADTASLSTPKINTTINDKFGNTRIDFNNLLLIGTSSVNKIGWGISTLYDADGTSAAASWGDASAKFRIGGSTWTNTSGARLGLIIAPIYNQASGTASNTDLLVDRQQTAVGSGAQLLLDLQLNDVSKFSVGTDGSGTFSGTVTAASFSGSLNASNITGTLAVANGGTGVATFASGQLIVGNGTSAFTSLATNSLPYVLTGGGSTMAGTTSLSGTLSGSGTISLSGALAGGSLVLTTGSLSKVQIQTSTMSNNAWNTVAEVTGQSGGVIDMVWLALAVVGGNADARTYPIRITFDGAGTPQMFGTAGASLSSVFGTGYGTTPTYRNDRSGTTINNSTSWSAFLKVPMPFNTGYKVEMFCSSTTGYTLMWGQVESSVGYSAWPLNSAYRLNATVTTATVASATESTGLDSSADTVLAGWWHFLDGAGSDFHFLEGDYRIYYNGSGTAGYRSSGTEDEYLSSYYFNEGLFAFRNEGLLVLDSTNYRISAYKWFDPLTAPRGTSELKLTWTNGDPAYLPPGYNTASSWTIFYYTK